MIIKQKPQGLKTMWLRSAKSQVHVMFIHQTQPVGALRRGSILAQPSRHHYHRVFRTQCLSRPCPRSYTSLLTGALTSLLSSATASCSPIKAPDESSRLPLSHHLLLLHQSLACPMGNPLCSAGKTLSRQFLVGTRERGDRGSAGHRLPSGNPCPNRWRPSRGGVRAEVVLRRHLSQAGGKLLH